VDALEKASVRPGALMPWYDRVVGGIRLKDGTVKGVMVDRHPDRQGEVLRWQVCEAGLIQAIGRGRGVNRTTEMPLDVDILSDVALPLDMDLVEDWTWPSKAWEAAQEGIWFDSPSDLAKAWPNLWTNEMAAKDWRRERLTADFQKTLSTVYLAPGRQFNSEERVRNEHGGLPLMRDTYKRDSTVLKFSYQHPGKGQKWRTGFCLSKLVPDAKSWLETRLGPIAGFKLEKLRPMPSEDAPSVKELLAFLPAVIYPREHELPRRLPPRPSRFLTDPQRLTTAQSISRLE
jgi:hypothetical protein